MLERFEAKFTPEPNSGCWLWTAATDTIGYGLFRLNGKVERAHRASFAIYRGSIPDGMDILHKCDVRACVNPDHLWAGTHTDNMRDMQQKGRQNYPWGERQGSAKLTEDQVHEIRRLKGEMSQNEIAVLFGVDRSAISLIHRGINWRHLQ